MANLDGKVALVTGGGGGIGSAIATALADHGSRVLLVDRSDSSALAGRLGAASVTADLTAEGAARQVVDAALERFGRLDLLVNAAGVQQRGPAMALSKGAWRRLQAINLEALFDITRAAAGAMRAAGVPGAICNVSSLSATVALPDIIPYGALKAAVSQLTRGLALELAADNIRVNAVAPGYVRTAMTADALERRYDEFVQRIPLRRVAEPSEIAPAVLFLLSPAASYITGAVLPIDGGYAVT